MKTLKHTLTAVIVTTSACALTPVFADENSKKKDAEGKRTLSAGIGFPDDARSLRKRVGLAIGPFPEYEGSDKYLASAFPIFDIRKLGAFFLKGASSNVNKGLVSAGLTIFHLSFSEKSRPHLLLVMGPLVRAYSGRDESDSDALDGLGDIDPSAGIGGFLDFSAGVWRANISVSPQDVGNDKDGLLAEFEIGYRTSVSDRVKLANAISTSWADDDYMQGYFGITDAQAMQSGYSAVHNQAGFKDVGIQLSVSYATTPLWTIEGQLGYWRLLNDAADNPIVKDEGSVNQIRGLLGFTFAF